MNRKIKFKVWDKENKKMIYNPEVKNLDLSFTKINLVFRDNEWEYLQFTGLKDEDGKEIYEGDIVRMYLGDGTIIEDGVIKFGLKQAFYIKYFGDSGQYCYMQEKGSGSFSDNLENLNIYNEIDCDDLKIIGNKYENPELLK